MQVDIRGTCRTMYQNLNDENDKSYSVHKFVLYSTVSDKILIYIRGVQSLRCLIVQERHQFR